MKKAILVSPALALISLQNVAQAAENAVYFVAQVEVTDPDKFFNSYGAKVGPIRLESASMNTLFLIPSFVPPAQ